MAFSTEWVALKTGQSGSGGVEYSIPPILASASTAFDWIGLVMICFILPAVLSVIFCNILREKQWIKENDLKLN